MLAGLHHGWARAGLVLLAVAAGAGAPAALGAGDTISLTLPHTISGGVPFPLSVSGTMAEAAAEVTVAFDPSPPASCPAIPTAGAHSIFRGPVVGPGRYFASSASLTVSNGSYAVCAWLTSAADPTSVLATYGPLGVSTVAGTPPPGSTPQAGSTPPPGDAPPRITGMHVQPATSAGLAVSVTLSESATVVLTLERAQAHGDGNVVGALRIHGRAGVNRLTVGRWSTAALAKGTYELVARAHTGGRRSSPRKARFTEA